MKIKRNTKKHEKKLQKALKKESKRLEKNKDTAYDIPVISWNAPDHAKIKKGIVWYSIFGTVFGLGAVGAYLLSGWSFAMVLAVFAIVYLTFDRKNPKKVKVILSEVGVKVGNKVYQYGRIQAFWLNYNPPFVKALNIRVHKDYMLDVEIQLHNQDPALVQQFLSTKVPELEGKTDGFLTTLIRLLKF